MLVIHDALSHARQESVEPWEDDKLGVAAEFVFGTGGFAQVVPRLSWPMKPKRWPATLRIWISSEPSVMR